jgi:hypothetical protein
VQHHWDHGGLQADRALDWQIGRAGRLRLDPVAEPAERSISRKDRADAGGERGKAGVPIQALDHQLDLGTVLVVVSERRERHRGLPRVAIAQDQQPLGRDALGQRLAAEGGGGKRRDPRVQRGEDGFARGVQSRILGKSNSA